MSTQLEILTNAPHRLADTKSYNRILAQLKVLNIKKSFHLSLDGSTTIQGKEDWSYQIIQPDEHNHIYQVEYDGDFMNYPIAIGDNWHITSCYKYALIYQNYQLDWFGEFRKEIFEILKILGGSEVIFLADNACHKLCHYFEGMLLDGAPYNEIKEAIQKDMGDPIRDYTLLNYDQLDYENITEYFIDDFRDLN